MDQLDEILALINRISLKFILTTTRRKACNNKSGLI